MVRIIGGGFSGLTLAFELSELKIPFELFEASDRLGGLIASKTLRSGIAETAANGLLWNQDLEILCTKLRLRSQFPKKSARNRWFYDGRSVSRWPLSLSESVGLAAFAVKYKLAAKSLVPDQTETVQEYFSNRLGYSTFQKLIRPALQGVYGPEVPGLSAELILRKYLGPRSEFSKAGPGKYRGIASFPQGMEELTQALGKYISQKGAIFLKKSVKISEFNFNSGPVVVCTDLRTTCELLKNEFTNPAELESLGMSGLVSATCFFRDEPPTGYQGFGCLWSTDKETPVLGVLFNSDIFPGRAQTGFRSETWILDYRKVGVLRDQLVWDVIAQERKQMLGLQQEPSEISVQRWPKALPIYDQTLRDWIDRIGPFGERHFASKPIRLHGNYLGEIGLSGIYQRSRQLALRLKEMA